MPRKDSSAYAFTLQQLDVVLPPGGSRPLWGLATLDAATRQLVKLDLAFEPRQLLDSAMLSRWLLAPRPAAADVASTIKAKPKPKKRPGAARDPSRG